MTGGIAPEGAPAAAGAGATTAATLAFLIASAEAPQALLTMIRGDMPQFRAPQFRVR
jgi:hypothetical protein